jgi:hypothetical protein
MATLIIPEALMRFSDTRELDICIQTLDEFSAWLEENHPKLYRVIFCQGIKSQEDQAPKKPKMNGFVNLYLEDRAVTHQLSEPVPIFPSSSFRLVTSVSGG